MLDGCAVHVSRSPRDCEYAGRFSGGVARPVKRTQFLLLLFGLLLLCAVFPLATPVAQAMIGNALEGGRMFGVGHRELIHSVLDFNLRARKRRGVCVNLRFGSRPDSGFAANHFTGRNGR